MSNWVDKLISIINKIDVEEPIKEVEQVTDVFITTKKAATMCGLSLGTVQKMADKGIFKYYLTFGGHRRILLSSVKDYLKARDSELENGGI